MQASNDEKKQVAEMVTSGSSYSFEEIRRYLPQSISSIISKLPASVLEDMEEIRLRLNKPLLILGRSSEYMPGAGGGQARGNSDAYIVNMNDIKHSVQLICNYSVYSFEDEIRNGFITINGGHRIGLCGKAVLEGNKVRTLKDITFVNFRIARQVIGAADAAIGYIIRSPDTVYNTLIISPPQCGKTTLIRDLVRQLSNGVPQKGLRGKKIGLVDERSEIAACSLGVPKNDVGIRTDVLDGCPKAEGIIMMIRSMSPDIIVTDELGRPEDADAILDAINAGVKVITTIHGSDLEDFLRKPALTKLHGGLFERYIILSRKHGPGTIDAVLDHNREVLL